MKQQINEIRRMQQLAGLITESQLNENTEAQAWLVDDEDGLPKVIPFASIEAAEDAQYDEMADEPYDRPLFTSLEDLKNYLDQQYMTDYDVELHRYLKENEEYLTPDQIRLIKSKDDSGESEAIEWRKLEAIITNLAPHHRLENLINYVKEVYDDAKNPSTTSTEPSKNIGDMLKDVPSIADEV